MTKNNKILIGVGLLVAGLWWWNKTKKEKKSNASGIGVGLVSRRGGNPQPSQVKYTPNSWYLDKNGKYHWVDGRGRLVS